MANNLTETGSNIDEEEEMKTQVKVTTLLDLKRRREALLAQKNIILKRKQTGMMTDNRNKHSKLCSQSNASDSTSEPIRNNSHQELVNDALKTTSFQLTAHDELIAQSDTVTFSEKSIFPDKMKITEQNENDLNIINIDNFRFIELENTSYYDFINNNFETADEILFMNPSTSNILTKETNKTIGDLNYENHPNMIADNVSEVSHATVVIIDQTSSAHPEKNINIGETTNAQPHELTVSEPSNTQTPELAIGETSNIQTEQLYVNDTEIYYGNPSINRKRENKANKDPSKWKKNLNQNLRMQGEAYLGYRRDTDSGLKTKVYHDVPRLAKSIKPACNSSFCKKSKLRNCDNIDEDKRKKLFEIFWKTMSWEQRRSFVCCHVTAFDKKVTKNPKSTRSKSLAYFLTVENNRHQVCKKMFLNTLGIKDWFVRYWLEKTHSAMPPHSEYSRNICRSKKKSRAHEYVAKFLNSLPKMPSHYCRSNTSRQYLEPLFQNMAQLYKEYCNKCEYEGTEYLSRRAFDNIFLKLNLSLYRPKKDRCDLCCGYEAGNISDVEITLHRERKEQARKEKEIDKKFAKEGKCHVFTQDVQAVKLAPYLQASAIYYKTKLCVHNFTMYNLSTHEAVCYWFDESNASLEASVFASCIVDQLKSILDRKLLPVILFSDGCCAQNRNSILSNALLRLSIEMKVTITQKYLEKGHTQMECDSVHSAIECRLKGKEIYLPSQYATVAKNARTNPMPYDCRILDFNFFSDFSKNLIYKTIRPGKKTNDPTVTDLKVLVYKPDGTIWYKLNFNDSLQPLPQRPLKLSNVIPLHALPKLCAAKIPITQRKYKDLQHLKAVLPSDCHSFYDDIPFKV